MQRAASHKQILCNIHHKRAVQMGSCLTCANKATICEVKGCITYHKENERAHNVLTLEQIRHVTTQFVL